MCGDLETKPISRTFACMNKKPFLVLGTAEFGRVYGEGVTERPSPEEIDMLLNVAWANGIQHLDVADSYGYTIDPSYFKLLFKSRDLKNPEHFYHYQPGEPNRGVKKASVYEVDQLDGLEAAIIPVNLNNTEFSSVQSAWPPLVYIRSPFDRGRLLKQGHTVRDCLEFVSNISCEGLIIGVNSVKELEEIICIWKELV